MKQKKIIMLLNNGFAPDLRVYKEAKFLKEQGNNVEIICMDRKNEYKDKPKEIFDGINITRFYPRTDKTTRLIDKYTIIKKLKYFIYFFWLLKFIREVKKYLKSNNEYEILHCHDLEMALCGVLFFRNKKVVFDMHEYYSNKKNKILNFFISKIVKYVQKRCKWIVHVNDFQVKDVRQREKLVYVPNYPEKRKFTDFKHKDSEKLRISYTGYVRHYIPLINLMKAVDKLNNVYVTINGEGGAYQRLKDDSRELKNSELTGKYDHNDIAKFYENSDLLYCVYNQQNKNDETAIPTKFYEALLTKIPLIVSKNSAMGDFVKKYNIGFEVDGTDYMDIKNVVDEILNNPNLLKEKAENIKNSNFEEFTWEKISLNLNKIYCEGKYE